MLRWWKPLSKMLGLILGLLLHTKQCHKLHHIIDVLLIKHVTKGTSILLVTFTQTHLLSLSIHGKSNLRWRRPKEIPSSAKLSVSYLWWLLCYECCCSMDLKFYTHKFVKTESTQFDKKTQNLSSVWATTWFSIFN